MSLLQKLYKWSCFFKLFENPFIKLFLVFEFVAFCAHHLKFEALIFRKSVLHILQVAFFMFFAQGWAGHLPEDWVDYCLVFVHSHHIKFQHEFFAIFYKRRLGVRHYYNYVFRGVGNENSFWAFLSLFYYWNFFIHLESIGRKWVASNPNSLSSSLKISAVVTLRISRRNSNLTTGSLSWIVVAMYFSFTIYLTTFIGVPVVWSGKRIIVALNRNACARLYHYKILITWPLCRKRKC